ncbi:MAG: histidine kinase dimerization/phosphoacceptor domain -containing protein [Desulfobacteraceae bacterium]
MTSSSSHKGPPLRGLFPFRDLSINRKLHLIMMVIATLILTVTCAAFVLIETQSFKQSMVRDLGTLAHVIGHNASAALTFFDRADAGETLRTLKDKKSVIAAWLYTREGALLATYRREGAPPLSTPPSLKGSSHRFENGRLVLCRRILLNKEDIGRICLVSRLTDMHAILKRNIWLVAAVLLGSSLLTYLLAFRLRKFISDPILDLARLARVVSKEKNYEVRAEKPGDDELGSLFDSFNQMLQEIHERDTALVEAKRVAETSAQETRNLLASVEQINQELEREVRERKRVEEEIMRHRHQLEELVNWRTHQLTEANLQLQDEIEERRNAERTIRSALEEKTVLLGEIHHRVKNNLQIIASLLELSRHRAKSPEAADQLSEAHAKIFTMALIHSQLYQTDRFDQVDMTRHARELFSHLSTLYARDRCITPEFRISSIRLPVTQAIPCALVLNELLSNAFKYAFDGRSEGVVIIAMEQEADTSMIHLEVRDNGVGIPKDIDIDRTDSLGLKLVRNLVHRQLQGQLQFQYDHGTTVKISFPLPQGRVPHA